MGRQEEQTPERRPGVWDTQNQTKSPGTLGFQERGMRRMCLQQNEAEPAPPRPENGGGASVSSPGVWAGARGAWQGCGNDLSSQFVLGHFSS